MLSEARVKKEQVKKNKQEVAGNELPEYPVVIKKSETVTSGEDNQATEGENVKIDPQQSVSIATQSGGLTTEQLGVTGKSSQSQGLNSQPVTVDNQVVQSVRENQNLGVLNSPPIITGNHQESSDGHLGDTQVNAHSLSNSSRDGNNCGDIEDKITQERSKFLNGLGIDIPDKLTELVSKATMEQLNNLRQLLKENKNLNNPVGFLIKALKNNWQPKRKSNVPAKPSWQEEFEEFYNQAIEAGYCEDLPINWLSRNHRNEPMVRVNRPWNGAPYTLLYWREAMQEFWGNRRNEL